MEKPEYKVYRFRWALLALILPAIVAIEALWLTLAPVSSAAMEYYHVPPLGVDMFSMSYMIMYIVMVAPASWVIDRFGFRASLAVGSVLMVVFSITRYLFAESYALALASQFMLAAAQPFLVNISTKVPANWFPVRERSTAAGLLIMAQYLGFILPMAAAPLLVGGIGVKGLFGLSAVLAVASAIPATLFTRERPPVPPGPEAPKEMMSGGAILRLLRNREYLWVLIISFVSMGLFNTLMTKLEGILLPRGIGSVAAGAIGAVFVVAGIIGAVAVPVFSDKTGRRVPLFVAGIALLAPLCLGLALFSSFVPVAAVGAGLGFLIMGIAPVLFQHGAEVAYPVPEGTSFGFVMLAGQVSGFLFVWLYDVIHSASAWPVAPMLFLVAAALLQIPVTLKIGESETLRDLGLKKSR